MQRLKQQKVLETDFTRKFCSLNDSDFVTVWGTGLDETLEDTPNLLINARHLRAEYMVDSCNPFQHHTFWSIISKIYIATQNWFIIRQLLQDHPAAELLVSLELSSTMSLLIEWTVTIDLVITKFLLLLSSLSDQIARRHWESNMLWSAPVWPLWASLNRTSQYGLIVLAGSIHLDLCGSVCHHHGVTSITALCHNEPASKWAIGLAWKWFIFKQDTVTY